MLSIVQRLPLGGWVRSVASTICRTLRAVIRRLGPRPGAVAVRAVRPPSWKRRLQNNTVTSVVRRARATPRLETPAEASRMRRARKATWRGVWGASRQASRMRRCSEVRGSGAAARTIERRIPRALPGRRRRKALTGYDILTCDAFSEHRTLEALQIPVKPNPSASVPKSCAGVLDRASGLFKKSPQCRLDEEREAQEKP